MHIITATYDLCAGQGIPRVPQCHMSQKTKSRGAGLEEGFWRLYVSQNWGSRQRRGKISEPELQRTTCLLVVTSRLGQVTSLSV